MKIKLDLNQNLNVVALVKTIRTDEKIAKGMPISLNVAKDAAKKLMTTGECEIQTYYYDEDCVFTITDSYNTISNTYFVK